jgi:hypothetical protein
MLFWTSTGPYLPKSMRPGDGEVESLDGDKAGIKAKFESWLRWSTGQGKDVVWRG